MDAILGSGTVLVTGAGVSGTAAHALLVSLGATPVLVDDRSTLPEVITTDAARALIDDGAVSLVVTSPGWRPDSPILLYAASAGVEVIGDVELAYRLDHAGVFGAPRTWLVVTGTNGKTTTTAMLADIMALHGERTGLSAKAVGNIGVAVADALSDPRRVDVLVAELSSFQLHWSSQLHADAGVLLNLAEDHLDWHGSMAAYAADKAKVLTATHPVAGVDDPLVRAEVDRVRPAGLVGFTLAEPRQGQVGVIDGNIVDRITGERVVLAPAEGIEPPGAAGLLDALAAAAVARTQGVEPATIAAALSGFTVAGHRGAVVHRGAKRWIDNSKATNPHAAGAALTAFDDGVCWIAGGQLKGAEVDDLVREHAHRLAAVALLGQDRRVLQAAVEKHAPNVPVFIIDDTDPEKAMAQAVGFSHRQCGDTVLLAPAAASLDMYTGMSQRGDLFAAAAARIDTHPQENR